MLSGGGEMGALIRAHDWSATPLGPMETWPQSLRMMVSILLANRFPMLLWWGPEYITLYNDAYRPILGVKHPWGLGKPGTECWAEIWDVLKPLVDAPFMGGPPTWMEDIELHVQRKGFVEETHFTIAYSPVPDDTAPRGIGGVLATVHEITEKVVGERRVGILRDLGARAAESKSAEDACALAARTLAQHGKDIPFALLYLVEPDGRQARLAGWAGMEARKEARPLTVDLGSDSESSTGWPLAEALHREAAFLVEDLSKRFRELPSDPEREAPRSAVVMPIRSTREHEPAGLLVAGVSPRLSVDHLYLTFLELVAAQIATAVTNARAYEEERKRAEALAEIDRAKTAFFSNVSHEFRTPLTLMLGPLEEVLAKDSELPAQVAEPVAVAHRNGLRLQKLVNSLLDFSRIEAGRMRASYQPTDLATLTAELASTFRSAMEKAGLALVVECAPLSAPVQVDREMWEKVVLNLLSNAFKYTFAGKVTVRIEEREGRAVLSVSDTGTGIPEHELPHLFERFHRVEGARGRTQEGTGIGLALVAEFVKLHGGTVEVRSQVDEGSTFTVSLPFGEERPLAEDRQAGRALSPTTLHADFYVDEVSRWLPSGDSADVNGGIPVQRETAARKRVLLADDNADMREYVRRLLAGRYEVQAVADGKQALAAAQAEPPDLVLSDIMMPGLDGFGLIEALRNSSRTATLPVILLSARAGEEARSEGMDAGADDYLVKPFSARELLARVGAHLRLAEERKRAEQQATSILESIADGFVALDRNWRFTYVNAAAERLLGSTRKELWGRSHWEVYAGAQGTDLERQYLRAMEERSPAEFENYYGPWQRWFSLRVYPTTEGGLSVYFQDITERKGVEQALRASETRFRTLTATMPQLLWTTTPDGRVDYLSEQWADYIGLPPERLYDWGWEQVVHPEDLPVTLQDWGESLRTGQPLEIRHRFLHRTGEWRWQLVRGRAVHDGAGQIIHWVGTCTDIHDRVLTQRKLELLDSLSQSTRELAEPVEVMAVIARMLGEHLDVSRCAYADVEADTDHFTILHDYTAAGVASTVGTYHLSLFGARAAADQREGRTLVIHNVDEELAPHDGAETFNAIGIKAVICCPLLKQGRLTAMMAVHQTQPRKWTTEEIELVQAVVERAWAYIERARAIRTLRESEVQYRMLAEERDAILGQLAEGVIATDATGRIVLVNDAAVQLHGVERQEVIDSSYAEVFHLLTEEGEAYPPQELPLSRAVLHGETVIDARWRIRRADGTEVLAIGNARPLLSDGQRAGAVLTVRDDTERRRAEEALAASQERLQNVFQQAPAAIAVFRGRDFVVELANPTYQAFLPGRELLGRRFADVMPELDQEVWNVFHRVLDTGEPFVANDWHIPYDADRDGVLEDHWFNVNYHPLREPDGRVSGFIAVLIEVTGLVTARKELERVNKELEEFAYVASHDLQEPLRMVNIYSQLLVRHAGAEDSEAKEFAGFIRQGVARMETLIHDLLTYSRTVQRDEQPAGTADLAAALSEAVSVLKNRMEESGAILTADAMPSVRGDTKQMAHVFQNLLSNALKYRKAGVPPEIRITAEEHDGQWTVTVSDNGIGFEQKYAERIFGLFKRLHKDEYPGTGLGLAICQRIVERYGGRLWAEGRPGEGATFSFSLAKAEEG